MSTVTPAELLKLWTVEHIPSEMAVGHILQNLVKLQTMVGDLRADVNRLIIHTKLPPNAKGKAKASGPDKTSDAEKSS